MNKLLRLATFAVAVTLASPLAAQGIEKRSFNVIGTWGNLTNWQRLEAPFWKETLPKASGDALKANVRSLTEANLKGTELLRLLKQGVYDFAAVLPIYVDDGGAVIEASDLAGVARDFAMARKIADLWLPEMQKVMGEKHGAIILAHFPFPQQVFFCRGDIASVADLKGKKIRVQGASQADFVTAVGGSPVTMAFGDVLPALEKGVVDCGITGTMPAYKTKWHEVVGTLFQLPVGFTLGTWIVNAKTWNGLPKATQDLIKKEMDALTDRSWKTIEAESDEGVACNTGTGACSVGAPGKVKLVKPSASDITARETALNTVVLANWAKRCTAECVAKWNEIVGKPYNLTAK